MTATPLDHDAYCASIASEIEWFADLLDHADLATPIPTCPGWDLDALAKHVGVIHRWAAQMIRDGLAERLDFREIEGRGPVDGQSRADWLRTGGDLLVGQLRAHPAETPVWTWGPGGTTAWWARRMAYETFVHRSDAVLALGGEPELAATFAVDGVDELLGNVLAAAAFAPAVGELRGDGETLHFHATDTDGEDDGEWMVTLTADGFTADHGHGKGDVAVRGAAVDLLLLVYGRRAAADVRFERFGDLALLDRWLAQTSI